MSSFDINKEEFAEYYFNHTNEETSKYFGISKTQLNRVINRFNVRKTPYKKKESIKDSLTEIYKYLNKDEFKFDCTILKQNELVNKYGLSIKTINNIKKDLNIGNRVKYAPDFDSINKLDLETYYNNHSNKETCERFGISNNATLNKVLERHGILLKEYRVETFESLVDRISKDDLEEYYKKHKFVDCEKHFNTSNLRKLLSYYGIEHKTKDHIKFEEVLAAVNAEEFISDYNTLGVYNIMKKYNISQNIFTKLVNYFNLGPKNYIFGPDSYGPSVPELEVLNYIKNILPDIDIICNERKTLDGQEIDIFIPSKRIGIEFNGDWWHCSLVKDKNYHQNKSKLAESKGIRLIHIYEYEWNNPELNKKIKQLLNIAFGVNTNTIYARQCEIKQITNKEAAKLNEEIHLQGHRDAQVTYGLFYENKLVQLMSFSKTKYNKNLVEDNSWEIIRGCPGSNNVVVGGVSKLFKHFILDYKPDIVFSYCDFNKFDGKSYEAIGMRCVGYTVPDMKYLMKDRTVVNRNPKKYKYNSRNSIARIYGSGSKKYVWSKEDQNALN